MLVKKTDAKQVSNSDKCTVWEYDTQTENFNVATAYIDGRFPDEKRVVNLELEEIYYVRSGSAVIHSEKGDFNIEKGDVYFFEKKEKFWLDADELSLVITCAPAFDPEQHKIVD
ncbi:MAG: cupin domain-containing protein [Candidatus Moraniibacteriota bacterium]|jgi:mannose-6-phosphate isomerase-like protein (cupin superfamily)